MSRRCDLIVDKSKTFSLLFSIADHLFLEILFIIWVIITSIAFVLFFRMYIKNGFRQISNDRYIFKRKKNYFMGPFWPVFFDKFIRSKN